MRNDPLSNKIDWITVGLYSLFVVVGWLSIYAADYDATIKQSMFSLESSAGRQLIWIVTAFFIIVLILVIDFRFYESFSIPIYLLMVVILIIVPFIGKEVSGNRSWLGVGSFGIQPSEFMKIATCLVIARYFTLRNLKVIKDRYFLGAVALLLLPVLLVIFQKDTGTAIVFFSLFLVLFREGLPMIWFGIVVWIVLLFLLTLSVAKTWLVLAIVVLGLLIAGITVRSFRSGFLLFLALIGSIAMVLSVDFVMNEVLRDHQRKRVMLLLNPNSDPLGIGWNTTQSKIAIGSGGLTGKGFLQGTQTKFDFVPAQTTDYIFCTIGEEQGWIGSTLLLVFFTAFLLRLITLAERQKSDFVRIYGYGVVSIFLFHYAINIGMTIGLIPVIGIPLPFFSYGGSSLWSFTILLFIFLKLDSHRMELLHRW